MFCDAYGMPGEVLTAIIVKKFAIIFKFSSFITVCKINEIIYEWWLNGVIIVDWMVEQEVDII